MSDFRDTRVGVTNAARILGVKVSVLKEAVRHDRPLHGVTLPTPIGYLGSNAKEMYFKAGEVMDCAEAINKARKEGER